MVVSDQGDQQPQVQLGLNPAVYLYPPESPTPLSVGGSSSTRRGQRDRGRHSTLIHTGAPAHLYQGSMGQLPSDWSVSTYRPHPNQTEPFLYHGNQVPGGASTPWSQYSAGYSLYPEHLYPQCPYSASQWVCCPGDTGSAESSQRQWLGRDTPQDPPVCRAQPRGSGPSVVATGCQQGAVCLVALAMAVAGIPTVPVPGVSRASVMAATHQFLSQNPDLDALWEEQFGGGQRSDCRGEKSREWDDWGLLAGWETLTANPTSL
ncbi:hypothetical protein EOD39_5679 [Acipenser ruthenus]|uniref:Uncharacterized protein n=1 Tax=Acipenser ruthenus TaxID=7906 RepID=A0A662YYU8_ACIRT|nr:hypothetical protein EOD39_5679 [Acipenser ruthenus]